MAKRVIDITKYFNNDVPEMVFMGKTYHVKNDKTTILLMQKLQREQPEEISDDEENSLGTDEKILKLLVGKEDGAEIMQIVNTSANYTENLQAVLLNAIALATGREYEELLNEVKNRNTP